MKTINNQFGYYMYLLIFKARAFLAGKSARVHGLSFERAGMIGAAADLFSRKSFNVKQRQQTILSFLSTAEKSRRQTGNNNFRNELTNIT